MKNGTQKFSTQDCLLLIIICIFSSSLQSEVTLDGSVGAAGTLSGPNYQITEDLGQRAGGNLFHSFGQFNLNNTESAVFSGSTDIQNVIGRVTGGQASNIDGTIRSTISGANLYFLNPAGVIFGENASLNVQGSFHASTADYLGFKDGVHFNNGTATISPIITTAAPESFGFLNSHPAGISVSNTVLKVPTDSTLSLVGGNITSKNSSLYAPSGQINLVSVDSVGAVIVDESRVDTTSFTQFGNIHLSHDPNVPRVSIESKTKAEVDVSADTAGTIFIRGGQLIMDNTFIAANTTNGNGGNIDIALTGNLNINGVPKTDDIESPPQSGIDTFASGEGNAGNIMLDVDGIKLTHRTRINSTTHSTGQGGDLIINANSILLEGNVSEFVPGLFTEARNAGNAGNIVINSDNLEVSDGAVIQSSTSGAGNAGNMMIDADYLDVSDGSSIGIFTKSSGNTGDLQIVSVDPRIHDSAIVSVFTNGSGNGGNLTINANTGQLEIYNNGFIATTSLTEQVDNTGSAGNISIIAKSIKVFSGSLITSIPLQADKDGNLIISADSSVDSGNISLKADHIDIYDVSGILTTSLNAGKGGNVKINADFLNISNKSLINAATAIAGNAGEIQINAKHIEVSQSNISATTTGTGKSGDLKITADDILLDNGASLGSNIVRDNSDKTRQSESNQSGDIVITLSNTFRIQNGSAITTESTQPDAGNIKIINGNSLQLSDSSIEASVRADNGKGGDIIINTPIVAFNNSKVKADAAGGPGGNITISGLVFESPSNEVTASSEVSMDGLLSLTPDTNISGSIAVLPDTLMNASQQLSKRCAARSGSNLSRFVVKGRGGIPVKPGDLIPSDFLDYTTIDETPPQYPINKGASFLHSPENDRDTLYSGLEKSILYSAMRVDCNQQY
ncbi:MAG: filamentous hemagglutinin N-terminal domain-containing protein [Methylococcales bacterium]